MKGCRPLTDSEIEQVLNSFDGEFKNRNKCLFVLGIKSGLRISSLISLTVGSVFQDGQIVDRVYIERRNVKRKKEGYSILLNPAAKVAIEAWLSEFAKKEALLPCTYLFQSRNGLNKPISRVQAWNVFKAAFAKSHLMGKLGCHSTRKSFAKKMYELLSHDLVKLQASLHQANLLSTVAYCSFREEEIDSAIMAL